MPVRRAALLPGTFFYLLRYRDDDPNFEMLLQHAVRVIDLILNSRNRRRGEERGSSNIKILWLGERLAEALAHPEDFSQLVSSKLRWLLALRQLILQRRLEEAARLFERLLKRGTVISTSLLWRAGFHILARVSEGSSAITRERRLRQVRASRLDQFMKQLGKAERSIIDRENLVLEYVLHCLADQDFERAVHVMEFLSKDSQPSTHGRLKEPEAMCAYHLRQCYIGLAHAAIWCRRNEELARMDPADSDVVIFEADSAADKSFSYLEVSLPPLVELGSVVDVFLEAWIRISVVTKHEDDVEGLLRKYVEKGVSPNAPRFLASWLRQAGQKQKEIPEMTLATVRAAQNDWSLLSNFLTRFPDHEAALELVFNFLDHPMAARRHLEAWSVLERLLRRRGDAGHWLPRQRLWRRVYFRPEALRAQPSLARVASLLGEDVSGLGIDVSDHQERSSPEMEDFAKPGPASPKKRRQKRARSGENDELEGGRRQKRLKRRRRETEVAPEAAELEPERSPLRSRAVSSVVESNVLTDESAFEDEEPKKKKKKKKSSKRSWSEIWDTESDVG